MKQRLLLLFFVLISAFSVNASLTAVGGIYYNFYQDGTAIVTYAGSSYSEYRNEYSGNIVIPERVTYNNTEYTVTEINQYAFYQCNIRSISIPSSVTIIGQNAFQECSYLTSINIPSSVSALGNSAFWRCYSLSSITIEENSSLTYINNRVFYMCSQISSFTIPSSITEIRSDAFGGTTLSSIICEGTVPPTIALDAFPNSTANVYVPCGSLAAYQAAQYWSEFTNIQEMECVSTEYTRSTTPGRYGTICLPKGVAHDDIEGGVFFNIVYAVTNTNMDITGILMEEETGDLVAGKPYIFRATADELVLPCTGEAVANPLAANGLVGNLSETPLDVPQGMYVLSNNQIRKLNGGTATAGQNRAYLDLTNVTKLNYVPSAAPNRVMLNAEGSSEATDLENIKSDDVQKVIRDGQLLIIRDGKIYNVLGMTL